MMGATLGRWRHKLRTEGLGTILARRLAWYKLRFQMDNWLVGRMVEATGNRVKIGGLTFSVDNPMITTRQKSTLHFGIYELGEIDLIGRHLRGDLPVVEMGGSLGVVSCLINRKLADPSKHVVVEGNPRMLDNLERNRDLNGCKFAVLQKAVGYGTPVIEFSITNNFVTGGTGRPGVEVVSVPTTSLSAIFDANAFETIDLVSDIEGAEVGVVENEPEVLRRSVRLIIMETHPQFVGEDVNAAMLAKLGGLGFVEAGRYGDVVALENRALAAR